jgi:hypothetical protein
MSKTRKFPLPNNTGSPVYGLGLLTDEPDYRLCWLLNQYYPWGLVRSADILVTDKHSSIAQAYTCFESISDHQPVIKLISNRSKEGRWLTPFRQIDFLLAFSDQDLASLYLEEIKTTIGFSIPQIRGLFKVPLPSFCYL